RSAGPLHVGAVPSRGCLEVRAVDPGWADPRRRPGAGAVGAAGARVSPIELQDLRRIVGAVARLRGESIREVTVRSDLRHVKVELQSGLILVLSAERDQQGRPYLQLRVVG